MLYIEHNNLIFRGEMFDGSPDITAAIVNGKWQPVSSQTMMDAGFYGTKLSESEAKEFQGDGWPEESSQSPQGESRASSPTREGTGDSAAAGHPESPA